MGFKFGSSVLGAGLKVLGLGLRLEDARRSQLNPDKRELYMACFTAVDTDFIFVGEFALDEEC